MCDAHQLRGVRVKTYIPGGQKPRHHRISSRDLYGLLPTAELLVLPFGRLRRPKIRPTGRPCLPRMSSGNPLVPTSRSAQHRERASLHMLSIGHSLASGVNSGKKPRPTLLCGRDVPARGAPALRRDRRHGARRTGRTGDRPVKQCRGRQTGDKKFDLWEDPDRRDCAYSYS